MNARRTKFVQHFLLTGNATKAYREAYGKSGRVAEANGCRLLRNAEVASAIKAAQERLVQKTEITLARWLEEWAALGFSNVEHYAVDPGGGLALAPNAPPSAMRAVSGMKTHTHIDPDGVLHTETEYKLWDKPSALRNIGQHLGFYPKEFGGEGAPNGRQPMSVSKDGEKTVIEWGDLKLTI